MSTDEVHQQALREAIAALERQRSLLGDSVVDAALAPLRQQLAEASAPAEPERRLRQVSVLFLDIVGSTQLIQHLDPEDVQAVVDGALAAFTTIVQRHGGEVLRYAGDNVKAAFGANGTREDDAERAVLCGLELLQEAARRGEAVLRDHGHEGFNARVGIHTGTVVRGGGIEKDKSLSGLAVNIAARMEQAAPNGSLRISQDTWALVRGLFDAEGQPPLEVKGHDAPITSWLVRGRKPRAFRLQARGIEGLETALVGRQAELTQLDAAFAGLIADGAPRALTLIADAGLGKSRLLHEFQHRLSVHPARFWLMRARSQPSGTLQPYGLLRDLLARRLDIADSDSAEVARAKLAQGLAPWLAQPGDPAPEPLGQLIGLDFSHAPAVQRLGNDGGLLRDRALAALRLWLARLAASDGSRVVLLLDDLHWSDEASLDALDALLKVGTAPMLVLACARPGVLERRPAWGAGWPMHQRLTLQALNEDEQAELTDTLLQRMDAVPANLAELIRRRAEGNPFYAEELVKMLLDQQVIETRNGDWHFHAGRLQQDRLPTTLTGVLQARIDALAPDARQALQLASVIGPVFWDDALGALDDRGPAALPVLQARAMVQPRPTSAFDDTTEESFHHHLLHQVSYDTVLKPQRREAHARVAAWLTERVRERSDEYLAITAEHHARAGQHALAADWFERAAQKALARFAASTVLQFLDRAQAESALANEPWAPQRLADAEDLRQKCCATLGLREQQGHTLNRLLALGESHDKPAWVARALSGLTLWAYRQGQMQEAEALAQRGAAVATAADTAMHAAICYGNLVYIHIGRREFDAARRNLEPALHWARLARERLVHPHDSSIEVQLLLTEHDLHAAQRDHRAATHAARRALAAVQRLNSPRTECYCRTTNAADACKRADLTAAAGHLDAAARLIDEFGLQANAAFAHRLRAGLLLLEGRWDEAAEAAAKGTANDRATGNVLDELLNRGHEAEAAWRTGRTEAAVAIWQQMVAVYEQRGDEAGRALAPRLRLADAKGESPTDDDIALARHAAQAGLPVLDGGVSQTGEFCMAAKLAAWRVLQRAGDPAAAGQLAATAAALEQMLSGFEDADVRERVARGVPWHRDVLDAMGLQPEAVRDKGWIGAAPPPADAAITPPPR